MITLKKENKKPIYITLYENIKADIEIGNIKPHEKLPSKRELSDTYNISVITVQNAYYQLLSEGFIYSVERSGYYACEVQQIQLDSPTITEVLHADSIQPSELRLYKSSINSQYFPFSTWAKLMRQILSENYDNLLQASNRIGVYELRESISKYLFRERGIIVNPDNMIIGAGTEYLYSIIIKILGRDKIFGVETPGYKKMWQVYGSEKVELQYIGLDKHGLSDKKLRENNINILHISPNHQFPTGIVMPYERRMEILKWANEEKNRYIIEDDYDSEFRFATKPIPSLHSLDQLGKVIYINTFSKTIAPSLRISYMILPDQLMRAYHNDLSFISNTVSSFEQYTLAKFINDGYYTRYLKKTKNIYKSVRDEIISLIRTSKLSNLATISEEHAGLHFALTLDTQKSDHEIRSIALQNGVRLTFLSDFMEDASIIDSATLIVSYSNFDRMEVTKIIDLLIDIVV